MPDHIHREPHPKDESRFRVVIHCGRGAGISDDRDGIRDEGRRSAMEICLVYPHQLFMPHPAVAEGRVIWLVEDPLFFGNDPEWPLVMHGQKLVLHRKTAGDFLRELGKGGG